MSKLLIPKTESPHELQESEGAVFEMDESESKHELVCTQINELQAEAVERELQGDDGGRLHHLKAKWDIYELP